MNIKLKIQRIYERNGRKAEINKNRDKNIEIQKYELFYK